MGLGLCHDRDTKKSMRLCRDINVPEAGAQATLPITATKSSLPVPHTGCGCCLTPKSSLDGIGLGGSDSSQLYSSPWAACVGVLGNRILNVQVRGCMASALPPSVSSEGLLYGLRLPLVPH